MEEQDPELFRKLYGEGMCFDFVFGKMQRVETDLIG